MGERGMLPGDPRVKGIAKHAANSRHGNLSVLPAGNPLDQPEPEIPKPPRGISRRARQTWDTLWTSSLANAIQETDMPAVHRWIMYVDRWYRVYKALENSDATVPGSSGQLVLNPLSTELQRLEGAIKQLEGQIGLTPMARARLGLTTAEGHLVAQQLNEMVKRDDPEVVEVWDGDDTEVLDVQPLQPEETGTEDG